MKKNETSPLTNLVLVIIGLIIFYGFITGGPQ
jgi:hypothetical protein